MISLEIALAFIFIFFLCWGSFLNVIAYRVAFDKPFLTKRSYCPSCSNMIAWYDNIPLFSWLILAGQCRHCRSAISPIYPLIELSTACSITLYTHMLLKNISHFYYIEPALLISHHSTLLCQWLVMVVFFSALLINTATDLYTLSIAQFFTLWLIPALWFCSWFAILPIPFFQSFFGSCIGYGILWLVAYVFKKIQNKEGIGEGDFELLALIGAVTGIPGVWYTLIIASASGSIIGSFYLLATKKSKATPLPFGPFLVLGAIIYLCAPTLPFLITNIIAPLE